MNFSKRINRGLCLTVCIALLLSIVFCCLIDWTNTKNDVVDAATLSSKVSVGKGDDLLLDDYDTRSDGNVFNGNVLSDLYVKLLGEGMSYNDVAQEAKKTRGGALNGEIHSGIDSSQIRDRNKVDGVGTNVVVKLGGLEWIVTSLSTAGNTPIVTLLLANNLFSCKFSTWRDSDTSIAYPSSMYSSSYIRARLLNGIGSNGQ